MSVLRRRVELSLASWKVVEDALAFAEEHGFEIPALAWEDLRTLWVQLHPKSSGGLNE